MDETNDLEALRKKRLEQMKEAQEQSQKTQEMLTNLRRGVLPFLDEKASERLDRVRMVDPMKAAKVESYVAQLARAGKISSSKKMSEQELLTLLKNIEPRRRETRILRR